MDYTTFRRITRKGNFVAWKSYDVTAIAYMSGTSWFDMAINCCRDGNMGEMDADGVYSRQWSTDEVWIDDEPRIATRDEVLLYLRKVNLKYAGLEEEGKMMPALVFEGNTIRADYNYRPSDFKFEFACYLKRKAESVVDKMVEDFFKDK